MELDYTLQMQIAIAKYDKVFYLNDSENAGQFLSVAVTAMWKRICITRRILEKKKGFKSMLGNEKNRT